MPFYYHVRVVNISRLSSVILLFKHFNKFFNPYNGLLSIILKQD